MADAILRDPLGRSLALHEHTWHGHILPHHPDMKPHRRLAEMAVVHPLAIHHSDADPDCRLYFGSGPSKAIMIVVVADVVRGFVKTAHKVKKVKGALEWSRPTPSKGS